MITKEIFEKYYKDKNVLCDTEEKAREYLSSLHELGYKWIDGNSLINGTHWKICGRYTYYGEDEGLIFFGGIKNDWFGNPFVEYGYHELSKEPLLTKEEKQFLKVFNPESVMVQQGIFLYIYLKHKNPISLIIDGLSLKFKGLQWDKYYTPKDLGL